jgi:hypothetical protein
MHKMHTKLTNNKIVEQNYGQTYTAHRHPVMQSFSTHPVPRNPLPKIISYIYIKYNTDQLKYR